MGRRPDGTSPYAGFLKKLRDGYFPTRLQAFRSMARRELTDAQRTELTAAVNTCFAIAGPRPQDEERSDSPAYLRFLQEAIRTNVSIARAMKDAKIASEKVDATEAQDVVNRLSSLFLVYNKEVDRLAAKLVKKTVY